MADSELQAAIERRKKQVAGTTEWEQVGQAIGMGDWEGHWERQEQRLIEQQQPPTVPPYQPQADQTGFQLGAWARPEERAFSMGPQELEIGRQQPITSGNYEELRQQRLAGEQAPLTEFLGDWDWRNPPLDQEGRPLGPNGEPLPENALGWGPDGVPDFGTGIQGWWKNFLWKIQSKPTRESRPGAVIVPGGLSQKQREKIPEKIPEETALAPIGKAIEEEMPGAGAVARATGAVVEAGLQGLSVPASLTANVMSVGQEWLQMGAQGGIMDIYAPDTLVGRNWAELKAPEITFQEFADRTRLAWEAGRVMYSGIVDPVVRTEFMNRVKAGEDPRFVAMELGSPVAEMIGQGIFDPLNLVGSGARAIANSRRIEKAMKEALEVAPEIDDFLRAADTLTDEQAAQRINDLIPVISSVGERAAKRVEDLATKRGLFDLTAGGARWTASRVVGETVESIAVMGDPDDTAEYLRALMQLHGNDAEKAAAIATIRHAPAPRVLLSDAAFTTGKILREMITGADEAAEIAARVDIPDNVRAAIQKMDELQARLNEAKRIYDSSTPAVRKEQGLLKAIKDAEKEFYSSRKDFLKAIRDADVTEDEVRAAMSVADLPESAEKFLDEIAEANKTGGLDAMIELVEKRTGAGVKKLFPTLTERIKAGDPNVTATRRALDRFHQGMQKYAYGWLNNFFNNVYLGLSPAYAMRNLQQNYVQSFLDYGPRTVFRRPAAAIENLRKNLGGVLPPGFEGYGSAGAVGQGAGFVKLSAQFEKNQSAVIMDYVVEKTMRQMLEKGLDTRDLINAGLSREAANALKATLINAKYDLDEALKIWYAQGETINHLETMLWAAQDDLKAIHDFGLYDDVLQAIRDGRAAGENVSQVQDRVRAIFDELISAGDEAVNDAPVVSRAIPGAEAVIHSADDLPPETQTLITNHYQANGAVVTQADRAINEVLALATASGQDASAVRRQYEFLRDEYYRIKDEAHDFAEKWATWKNNLDAAFGRKEELNLARLWNETGMTTEPPKSWGEFKQRFWEEFFYPTQNRRFIDHRERWASLVETVARDTAQGRRALELNEQARVFDQIADRWQHLRMKVRDAIEKGDNAQAARLIANQYGISTISENGKPLDKKILNFINANLPEGAQRYTSLDDVDPEIAREAIVKHVLKNASPGKEEKVVKAVGRVPETAPVAAPAEAPQTITRQATRRTTAYGVDPSKEYEFEFKVLDLDDLIPSHTDTLAPNPNFPQELQPRLRDRTASEMQVDRIARELNPDAMLQDTHRIDSGPMIIGPDNIVESGNGRTLALRRARLQYPEQYQEYVNRLREILPELGITESELAGVNSPVLVRVRRSNVNRVEFVNEANQAATLRMSPFEQAIQDSRLISDNLLANLEVGETQSIDQALSSTTNRALVRGFLDGLPETERAALIDAGGSLNRLGLDRLKNALFAHIYPGEAGQRLLNAFTESIDPGIKSIENALYASLPELAQAEGMIKAGNRAADLSIAEDLSKTIDVYARLKQNRMSVTDYLAQTSIFEQELSPFQQELLRYLAENARSQKRLREMIKGYARGVIDQAPAQQMDMFGGVRATKGEILENVVKKLSPDETPLFGQLEETPEFRAAEEATRAAEEAAAPAASTISEELAGTARTEAAEEAARAIEPIPTVIETPSGQFDVLDPGPAPYTGDVPPSPARVIYEQRDGLSDLRDRILAGIADNWSTTIRADLNDNTRQAIAAWVKMARERIAEARAVSIRVADAARDFTLLPYGNRRGFDLLLAYIYPYHYWYSRNYAHWLKRIWMMPDYLAHYGRYKDTLAQVHAGAPEWWKYQINTNELFGLDSENPLYFNVEATLNPLNGLTGVDFTDGRKRVTWYASLLDDLGKFGPSTWTPFSWAVAVALYLQAENETDYELSGRYREASARWAGRLFPQTTTVKTLLNLFNVKLPFVKNNEIDPLASGFYSRGYDFYEHRRINRALAAMVMNGEITQQQMAEAARTQEGEIWDLAADRSTDARWMSQFASFLFGVGWKGRSPEDMMIDQFYNQYYRLWNMEDNLSPEEFQQAMEELRATYPFMDALLIGNKFGLERDRTYIYNVFSRIPPGQKDDLVRAAGLDGRYYDLFQKFYDDKGHIENWPEADRNRLLLAATELGAFLEMPDDATRQEWLAASQEYKRMQAEGERIFGRDTWSKINFYRGLYGPTEKDRLAQRDYLDTNPDLQAALAWMDEAILNTPILAAYYGSIGHIRRYLNNQMYDRLKKEFGYDNSIWDQYNKLVDEKSQYWRDHPELEEYGDLIEQYEAAIQAELLAKYGDWQSAIDEYYRLKESGGDYRSYSRENAWMWDARDEEKRLRSEMYAAIKRELGADIFDKWDEYNRLQERIENFEKSKDFNRYRKELDRMQRETERMILQLSKKLPEGAPARTIGEPQTITQEAIWEAIQPDPVSWSEEDLREMMGSSLFNLVRDFVLLDATLPAEAERRLERFANEMDVSVNTVLAWVEMAE